MNRPALNLTTEQLFNANRAAIALALEIECKECDGRGTVAPSGNGPYWDSEREECEECSGHGYIEPELRHCDDCDYFTDDADCICCPECRGCVA